MVTIANSVTEFSGTQGLNNWYYGYYDGPFASSDFQPMTEYVGATWLVDDPVYWTSLTALGGHPNGIFTGEGRLPVEQWAVRRYISEVNGEITVTGIIADANPRGGNGIIGHIFVDGRQVGLYNIANGDVNGISYTVTTNVRVGSVVDFAIDPKNSDDPFDGTTFTAEIDYNSSPPLPTISLGNNITVREGNSAQTNVNIPITLSRPSSEPIRVNISTANGTATGGTDFTPLNQSITFSANSTSANVTLAVRGDTTVEPNETFFVNLGNPVGATIARGRTQITINTDDLPPSPQPSISIQDAIITEGNSGIRNMTFNVRLSGRSSQTISADYITGNGTARAPSDYDARSNPISFAPGRTTGTISIPIRGDTLFEPNETFTVSLSNLRNVRAGDIRATGTILNDDIRSRNINSLSLGKSDSIPELTTKALDYADLFGVDTGV
jgi:hypothetical protein